MCVYVDVCVSVDMYVCEVAHLFDGRGFTGS